MELVGEVPDIRERLGGGRQRDERLLPSLRLSHPAILANDASQGDALSKETFANAGEVGVKAFPRALAFYPIWHERHASEGEILSENFHQAISVSDAAEFILHHDELLLAGF